MRDHFFRAGIWIASFSLFMSTFFVPFTPSAQAAEEDPGSSLTIQSLATNVVINEVLPQANPGNFEYVELFNPTPSVVDISGWTISNSTSLIATFPAGTSLVPGAFTSVSFTDKLNDATDAVFLKNGSAVIDSIRYGQTAASQLRAPDHGKTLGRLTDGNTVWYTNLIASERSSNSTANPTVTVQAPTGASVQIGDNNPANIINLASKDRVLIYATVGATSVATDTVTVDLLDSAETSRTVQAAATTGAGTIPFPTVNTSSPTLMLDGTITLRLMATNANGVSTAYLNGTPATKDTVAPDGSVQINNGASVTASSLVNLSITASDVGLGVSQMRLSNVNSLTGSTFEAFATSKAWTLTAGEGLRSVYIQFKDAAGNVSPARNLLATNEAAIRVKNDLDSLDLLAVATGTQTIRKGSTEVIVTGTAPTTLTIARYHTNPGTDLPTGTTGLGRFVEVGIGDPSRITFPAIVKFYYTSADLAAAGITNENQLQSVMFFDAPSQSWKSYASTGVSTADVMVDGVSYDGFVYANVDHFTPMTVVADTTPPATVSNLTVIPGNGLVDLSWSAVTDATSYVVRYRVANTNDSYTLVTVNGSMTNLRITGLQNGTTYEFGIASQDSVGNTSSFVTSTSQPTKPTPSSGPGVMATQGSLGSSGVKTKPTTKPTVTPTESATPTPSPTESSAPEEQGRNISRLLVTLAILVIAIGAGTAGYYGYQWWVSRPTPGPKPPVSGGGAGASQPNPPVSPPTTPPPAMPPKPPVEPEKPTPPSEGNQPPTDGRW